MNHKKQHAFNMVELLIILTLLSLLALIAAPDLASLIEQSRIYSLRNLLKNQLIIARTNSVLHNRDIEICGSSNGQFCDDQWPQGWLLRTISDNKIIHHIQLSPRAHIRWSGATQKIRFHSNGTSPLGNGRFYFCDRHEDVILQIVINRQGRLRQATGLEPEQDQSIKCSYPYEPTDDRLSRIRFRPSTTTGQYLTKQA